MGRRLYESNLGPCCACRREGPAVRNIVMLERRGAIEGRGWGCLVCGLEPVGITYVLCDRCFERQAAPVEVCRGYPGTDGRMPLRADMPPHKHRLELHTEIIMHPPAEEGGGEDECL